MIAVGVIDDDEEIGVYLKALLEESFSVRYYESWREAKEPFTREPPEIILLDISMPDIKGEEVLREMRQIPTLAMVRVFALTGFAMEGDREKFLKQGFDGYFAKPLIDIEPLFEAIEEKAHPHSGDRR